MEIDRALANAANAKAVANAFITVRTRDELLADAGRTGPLAGVLLSVKDDLFTAGIRTTGGSLAFPEFVPDRDAPVVAVLRQAGASVLGKTNLCEFAMSLEEGSPLGGPCLHPEAPGRWAGASSGGAAAAAFLEAGDAAVATDSGGSARAPAALCGVACYNPTPDGQLRGGSFGANRSLLSIGILSRGVRIAGFVGRHLLFDRESSPTASPLVPMSRFLWSDLSAGMEGHDGRVAALAHTVASEVLPGLGLREVTGDAAGLRTSDTFAIISDFERLRDMTEAGTLLRARPELLGSAVKARLERASGRTRQDYQRALGEQAGAKQALDQIFAMADVIVAPTITFLAPELSLGRKLVDAGLYGANLTWVNLGELPAVSLPIGRIDGLPVALQIVARRHDDERLLRLAENVEAHVGWSL